MNHEIQIRTPAGPGSLAVVSHLSSPDRWLPLGFEGANALQPEASATVAEEPEETAFFPL